MTGFTSFYNSISVILGWWEGENERLCAMEPITNWNDYWLPRVSNQELLDQKDNA